MVWHSSPHFWLHCAGRVNLWVFSTVATMVFAAARYGRSSGMCPLVLVEVHAYLHWWIACDSKLEHREY